MKTEFEEAFEEGLESEFGRLVRGVVGGGF